MGEKVKLPVIHLELNTGVFRIPTREAIFEISVKPDSSLTQVVEEIVEQEIASEPAVAEQKPLDKGLKTFSDPTSTKTTTNDSYREISEEMFKDIGEMARTLSMSIEYVHDDSQKNVDVEKAGIDLESAKGSLNDIVKITEKATMDIMDISDNINENCDAIKKNLADIKKLDFVENHAGVAPEDNEDGHLGFLEDIIKKEQELKDTAAKLTIVRDEPAPTEPESVSEPEQATEKVKVYNFDLDVVFQTLYELCTNESVKKSHLQPMRAEKDSAFDVENVLKSFSDMAPDIDAEDNFFNFPVSEILKILYKFSKSDENKQILKKMNQTAASIFLDQTLPIEATIEEKEVSVKKQTSEPVSSTTQSSDSHQKVLDLIDENIKCLKEEVERLKKTGQEGGCSRSEGFAMIKQEDHKALISAVESTDKVIQGIISNMTSILESLTFQDLSGQRIKKIAALISNVQVQLLSVLLTFGIKLKNKEEGKDITMRDAEEKASKEVDKMMGSVCEDAGTEKDTSGPLDQNAVNDLLAELGF